jgi:hypothetical protein
MERACQRKDGGRMSMAGLTLLPGETPQHARGHLLPGNRWRCWWSAQRHGHRCRVPHGVPDGSAWPLAPTHRGTRERLRVVEQRWRGEHLDGRNVPEYPADPPGGDHEKMFVTRRSHKAGTSSSHRTQRARTALVFVRVPAWCHTIALSEVHPVSRELCVQPRGILVH